ncbi:MAG: NAD(P)-binding oxidoreductase [Chloroflexota bacterium]
MNIIVFGASGRIGQLAIKQGLDKGHTITGFVRSPEKMTVDHPNLTLIQGDALDQDAAVAAIAGHDAVICALGGDTSGEARFQATQHIVAGMQKHGVERLSVVSSLGVGESIQQSNLIVKALVKTVLRSAIADHQKQEDWVRQSDLSWTIVRAGGLTNDPFTGTYIVSDDLSRKLSNTMVPRADVADFLIRSIEDERFYDRALALVGSNPGMESPYG